ncbi:hypothetical protein BG53_08030 [Paenibacillus darwinianus]|uniref:DUF3906 domain-containing protein n=1 Tax=Paenibacillus darwinianus TaxID=1380763 RepID=A0A9W5RYN4_9BACL|nr:DUF3906 family protein [Paenibacillus darwinianus]EXX85517.1 hypothetical protein CH50_09275 [Paenibacillus darwinianus]EXX85580.1 hypothetical protein BG53_08030 [Paenibacillus darwinianus]EXX85755.1 hypothetical protein BG52_07680 [Paenibacillus darwinianus]
MFLYKIEIELPGKLAHLILLADGDEKAFSYVESHVARHFVQTPEIRSTAIVEKKRLEPGSGYLIE